MKRKQLTELGLDLVALITFALVGSGIAYVVHLIEYLDHYLKNGY